MSVDVKFRKKKAALLNASLVQRRPIKGIRTIDDLLALAGACFLRIMLRRPGMQRNVDWSQVPLERQEAAVQKMTKEISAAIEYCGHLISHIDMGEYDRSFEPHFRFRMSVHGDEPKVECISGSR